MLPFVQVMADGLEGTLRTEYCDSVYGTCNLCEAAS